MKTETMMKGLIVILVTFLLMTAAVSNAQTLKLNAHILDDEGSRCFASVQVKEYTESGPALIREFKVRDGNITIPLQLGKKYVLHFLSPGRQFKSVIVDCTGNHLPKEYSFGFDITLFIEAPAVKSFKDLVAKVWLENNSVQYTLL